jgi:REP element-mobilizing transposase RayT
MDRYWLLTNTCYGNWLPGDRRGFVGRVWEHRPDDPEENLRVIHAVPGIPYDEDIGGSEEAAHARLRAPPIHLEVSHAEEFLRQIRETAKFRGWELRAVAVMFNHFHIVVGAPGDPKPSKLLGDFKSWGTRALSKRFGVPASETWWTERGSKRKLPDERALATAIHYVLFDQPNPLVTWSPETRLNDGPPP